VKYSFHFNRLEISRYQVTYYHNEDEQPSRPGMSILDPPMTITYNELVSRQQQLHSPDGRPTAPASGTSQVMRNLMSSLHSFLAFNGKTLDSVVGKEMLADFDKKLKSYSDAISVSDHTKADRRSHLRTWRSAAEVLLAAKRRAANRTDDENVESEFHVTLRHAIAAAGENPMDIARRAGASEQAVQRWLKGAIPNGRAMPSLRRLELALGLEADSLRQLVPRQREPKCFPTQRASKTEIPYRVSLKERTADAYCLKAEDFLPGLSAEWRAFLEYKTSKLPKLNRSSIGKWRLLPKHKVAGNFSEHARKGNFFCPTAQFNLRQLRALVGYLARPIAAGGFGISMGEAQTMAWFAVPQAVNGFLEFLTERSGGVEHGGHVIFASLASSLTHPVTGYLTQQPAFAKGLPNAFAPAEWTTMCKETYALCAGWKRDARNLSRDPTAPIHRLLDLAEPLGPIFKAVETLDLAAASAPSGSLEEAIHKRDALLLSMLTANPLRNRNYVLMTWKDDNSGVLYRRQDGQWRIRFGADDFKNDKHSIEKEYDAPLPRTLNARINEYLEEYRPRLIRVAPEVSWVFPSSSGTIWLALSRRVAKVTRRLIPETPGFGTHAFRHLVATDYLRKHPNDFLTVAILLHDTLETVLKAYAHLRQDESFEKFEAHLRAIAH
jgi:integrase